MKPNLIIFRHPELDNDGNIQFVSLAFDEVGMSTSGHVFCVNEGDSYLEMNFDHIILAHKVPEGSIDLQRYKISNKVEDPNVTIKIFEMCETELNLAVQELVREFNLTNHS